MSVLYDIQAIQSRSHGDRGIARYTLELARALLDLGLPEPTLLLNPRLHLPAMLEPLASSGRLKLADRVEYSPGGVYHVGSPFELDVPLDDVWPRKARVRRLRLAVTVYDLIPLLYPDRYLVESRIRREYSTRVELLRRADRILTISQATARDVGRLLEIDASRIVNVGTGVSERFRRPDDRERAFARARERLPWLERGFVLYTGGIEPRKNVDGLLDAYARLPPPLRGRHKLVVVCHVDPRIRPELERRLERLGLAGDVRFAGWVPDPLLVLLYQACGLFVFPSLYEGFGLPVAEAIACGAPVVASRSSAIPELVPDPDALFDPTEPAAIAATLERALTSEATLERLSARRLSTAYRWPAVAERVASVYEELLARGPRVRRRRRRVAFATPLPPQRSGVATYSYRLLEQLRELCDVDAFVDAGLRDTVSSPPGVEVHSLADLETADAAVGGYDRIVYCFGNSPFHAETLACLRRMPGAVIAHDVRLASLYEYASRERPEIEPRSFYDVLQGMYRGRVPSTLGLPTYVTLRETSRYGIAMAREVIAGSERYLTHSAFAASLARLDAAPEDEKKVGVIPFGMARPELVDGRRPDEARPVIATFGWVSPSKRVGKLLEALPRVLERHPGTRLAIVGPVKQRARLRIERRAEELGVADHVAITGELDDREFYGFMARASIAVQLRTASNGESSASVGECLASGIPTVVTAFGSARELADDAVVKVEPDVGADELGTVLSDLLADRARREALGSRGEAYAREHSFRHAADALYSALGF